MSVNHRVSSGIAAFASIIFCIALPLHAAHTRYYVDATSGNDGAAGTSPAAAWKSLSKINGTTFGPGDTILLKSGSVWTGSLSPQGSGASGSPNVIDTFGTGAKPIINANGAVANTFSLSNQQYWEVNNLELTNDDNLAAEDNAASRTGFRATATSGIVNHVYVRNCYIHDVDGNADGSKGTGGIVMPISGGAHFNDVLLEGNTIRKVDRTGIEATAGGTAVTTNMVIRNNSIISTGGDAMIVQGCMKALVEYNIADGCAARCTSCNAGIWPWASDSTLFQFNEACRTVGGGCDRSGFDCDWKCRGTVFQYNYSHNNGGGFMLICSPGTDASTQYNLGSVVRYNISQNDQYIIFDIKGPVSQITRIYNNDIYVDANTGTQTMVADGDWGGAAGSTFIYNNIFYALTPIIRFGVNQNYAYDNNCYYLPNSPQALDTARHKHALIADPIFENPGTGANGIGTLGGYKLKANSPCIGKGMDLRALGINPGTRDYFGNPIPAGAAFDIGAHEFPGTVKPACVITSPRHKQSLAPAQPITLTARAWSADNIAISSVAFYQGATKICDAVNGANGWSCAWSNAADGSYTITAQVTDAQAGTSTSAPVTISVGYRNPENPVNAIQGLEYKSYTGVWPSIPNFAALTPVKSGTTANFLYTAAGLSANYGIRFTGYLEAPADGIYTLYSNSDDASNVYIGTTLVVANDGMHGPQEAQGAIGLKAGKHAITADFMQAGGGATLTNSWMCASAGITKQVIPANRLYYGGTTVVALSHPQIAPQYDLRISYAEGAPILRYSTAVSDGAITIRIINHQGQTVCTIPAAPGEHAIACGRDLAPGQYLCVMKAGRIEMKTPLVVAQSRL